MGNTDCSCIRQYMQKEPTMMMEPATKEQVMASNEDYSENEQVVVLKEGTEEPSEAADEPSMEAITPVQLATTITLAGQLSLQNASRGFMTRSKLLSKFREAKFIATDEKLQMERLKPEKRFKVITDNIKERLKGPLIAQIEEKYGKFKKKEALEDGVEVDAKPAFKLSNGVIYKGEWNKWGQKHGRGKEVWPDGTWYSGYFKQDKMSGIGRLVYPNGDMYEGEFKKGLASGQGVIKLNDGGWFEGMFKRNQKHGYGKEYTSLGDYYEGHFIKGRRDGHGVLKRPTGEIFEGEFKQGHPGTSHQSAKTSASVEAANEGVVDYKMPNGDIFKGTMRKGRPHGRGLLTRKDGSTYNGQFVDGKMEGYGEFRYNDGRIYKGQWKNGVQHGEGTIQASDDAPENRGVWANGKKKK